MVQIYKTSMIGTGEVTRKVRNRDGAHVATIHRSTDRECSRLEGRDMARASQQHGRRASSTRGAS